MLLDVQNVLVQLYLLENTLVLMVNVQEALYYMKLFIHPIARYITSADEEQYVAISSTWFFVCCFILSYISIANSNIHTTMPVEELFIYVFYILSFWVKNISRSWWIRNISTRDSCWIVQQNYYLLQNIQLSLKPSHFRR